MFDWRDFAFAYSNLIDESNDLYTTIEALRKMDLNYCQKVVLRDTLTTISVVLDQYAKDIRSELNEEEKSLS